jgi:hypothetical protein
MQDHNQNEKEALDKLKEAQLGLMRSKGVT